MNFLKYVAFFFFSLYNICVIYSVKELKMKKYIKENLESIGKLFINHIGMTIFSLVVLLTARLINNVFFYVMGGLAVLMYFSLLYTAMWERGAKDKVKIDGGREKCNIFNGLYFYLLANAFVIFTALISLILAFFITDEVSNVNNVYSVFRLITHFYNGMYMPITKISSIGPVLHSCVYLSTVIPGAIVSFVSYILGVKGFKCIFPESKKARNRRFD